MAKKTYTWKDGKRLEGKPNLTIRRDRIEDKIDEAPVELRYSREQLVRIANAVRYTQEHLQKESNKRMEDESAAEEKTVLFDHNGKAIIK